LERAVWAGEWLTISSGILPADGESADFSTTNGLWGTTWSAGFQILRSWREEDSSMK
jgi:hypothetical protein